MPVAQTLPFEVLSQIISLVTRLSAYQCMLVCNTWYWTSIRIFYKDFTLHESNLHSTPQALFFLKTSKSSNLIKHSHLIKILRVNTKDCFSLRNPWQSFHQVLHYLPSLTVIDLSTTRFWKSYLYLIEAHQKRGKLPQLQKIKLLNDALPSRIHCYGARYFASYYCHDLAHLDLNTLKPVFYWRDLSGLHFLPLFKKNGLVVYKNTEVKKVPFKQHDDFKLASPFDSLLSEPYKFEETLLYHPLLHTIQE